jgi:hypothetical protein
MAFRSTGLALLILMGVATTPALAANCSLATYQRLANEADRLTGPMNRCSVELNKRTMNIKRMCAVCGPTFVKMMRFERDIRKNRACYSDDRKLMRTINEFSAMRGDLRFLRRGCGY